METTATTNGTAAKVHTDLAIFKIRTALIDESPLNPRKTFAHVDELAADIKERGILSPLLLRPKGKRYEVVFGSCRLRGAIVAGLDEVPAMLRELDDAQALEIMIVENSKRADIHPMEEAAGFEMLQEKQRLSVDDLAAKVGKSRAYVYARLKLLDLVPEARDAFYKGEIAGSVALGVARVPASMQVAALKTLHDEAKSYTGDDKLDELSVRHQLDTLRERYTLRLASAPFDRSDATLVPAAGACGDCPKRTGRQREMFGDAFGADEEKESCTDPECFGQKREAHAAKQSARLEAKGVEVVKGKPTRFGHVNAPKGYVKADEYVGGHSVGELLKKAKKKPVAKAMMIGENGKAVEVVKKDELLAAAGVKERAPAASRQDWEVEQAKRALEQKAEDIAENNAVVQIVEKVSAKGIEDSLLRALCVNTIGNGSDDIATARGWKPQKSWNANYTKEVAGLKRRALEVLLVEAIVRDRGSALEDVCALLKIDLKALKKAALAEVNAAAKPKEEPKGDAAKPAKKATTKKKPTRKK